MTATITHAYVATGTDAGNGEVHKNEWNAAHTIIGLPDGTVTAGVTAGTNAQGQGALTSDLNTITTTAANPSGVTLPTATAGRFIKVVNAGTNPIAVFPASGAAINSLAANASTQIAVGASMQFWATSATQWYTSNSGSITQTASGAVGIGRTAAAGYSFQTASTIGANDGTVEVFMAPVAASSVSLIGNVTNHGLAFYTNNAERARITNGGDISVTGVGSLGYGAGSGGTVTQLTSKSTAVTLNKFTGSVTMNAAALGGGASAFFSVNNSILGSTDTVVVNVGGGGFGGAYYVDVTYCVAAASFGLRVTNNTGGSLSEAVVVNFAIIRASSS